MKAAGLDGRVPGTSFPIVAVGATFLLECPDPPQPARRATSRNTEASER
jgi:hypothetical protein